VRRQRPGRPGPRPALRHGGRAPPGCNMAFRRDRLLAIGGFDPSSAWPATTSTCAGASRSGLDPRLPPVRGRLHHRRGSVRRFWRQQLGYGRAKRSSSASGPRSTTPRATSSWAGRLYGRGARRTGPLARLLRDLGRRAVPVGARAPAWVLVCSPRAPRGTLRQSPRSRRSRQRERSSGRWPSPCRCSSFGVGLPPCRRAPGRGALRRGAPQERSTSGWRCGH
jgi:hypothetical protein